MNLRKILGRKSPLFRPFIRSLFIRLKSGFAQVANLVRRMLAPLRRIVSREVEQFRPDPRVKHEVYSLLDTLECGHVQDHFLWGGLADLLNAYTENPLVRSARHRCQTCAQLTSTKKPVQSVTLRKAAGVA